MLTDFDRGLGYGLIVALACSAGAFWLGQDHAPEPVVVGNEWVPACDPRDESDGVNVVEIAGDTAIASAGCEYNGERWVCADGPPRKERDL